ncbi:MAG: L-threonylcarbamoyladenylate synthase [Bacillota bacterium]
MQENTTVTKLLKVDRDMPDPGAIREAASVIQSGGLVAFPTETVYGLGANGLYPPAVRKIFEVKGRPQDNPLILHVSSRQQARELSEGLSDMATTLIDKFWPGPLTVVAKKHPSIPVEVTAGHPTVALRMPDCPVALALISASGVPIAAPSANTSGRPSPVTAQQVLEDLGGRIGCVLDAGPTGIGVESTVIDTTGQVCVILRPGGVTREQLEQVLGAGRVRHFLEGDRLASPGMKHTHYAPRSEMWVVEGDTDAVVREIKRLSEERRRGGHRVGILATNQTRQHYTADVVLSLGDRDDLSEIARNLYTCLRQFDSHKINVILAEGFPREGLGEAICDRLHRASGGRVLQAGEDLS